MVRNKYAMPDLKQPICTIKWMQSVRDGLYWCPRGELAVLQIASAPTKQQLAEILMAAVDVFSDAPVQEIMGVHDLDAMVRTAELVLLRPPNADWTINVVGLLNPRHPIFSKRYVAPKPVVNRAVHAVEYDNGDEFFDDLPDLTPAQMRARALPLPKSA